MCGTTVGAAIYTVTFIVLTSNARLAVTGCPQDSDVQKYPKILKNLTKIAGSRRNLDAVYIVVMVCLPFILLCNCNAEFTARNSCNML